MRGFIPLDILAALLIAVSFTSIVERRTESPIDIWSDSLSFDMASSIREDLLSFSLNVYTLTGKEILSSKKVPIEEELGKYINRLNPGIYFAVMKYSSKTVSRRIIIIH